MMLNPVDVVRYGTQVLVRHRFRSLMILVSVALGVASIVVLTALGEGARRYVLGEFAFLGKDILIMVPGKKETTGGLPPLTGTAARDITLADVQQLQGRIAAIREVAPLVIGSAEISYGPRARQVTVLGSSDALIRIRQLELARGRNLELGDLQAVTEQCLIGETVEKELFGTAPVVGRVVRVGDYRCRVVGVLSGRGDAFGMDLSDTVVMAVASAQRLFDTPGLFRVLLRVAPGYELGAVKARIISVMKELHQGEEDITLISPDALLSTFDEVLQAMTLGVAVIAAISMLVAGVLIMNIMLISISQRTEEIGLLKALGARAVDIQQLFLMEAFIICAIGALAGVLLGWAVVLLARGLFPQVPFAAPAWAVLGAVFIALLAGMGFAWGPAKRASRLLPVNALYQRK